MNETELLKTFGITNRSLSGDELAQFVCDWTANSPHSDKSVEVIGNFFIVYNNYKGFSDGGKPYIDFISDKELGILLIGGKYTCEVIIRENGSVTGHS